MTEIEIKKELYVRVLYSLQYTVELLKGSCDGGAECEHCVCFRLVREALSEIEQVKH